MASDVVTFFFRANFGQAAGAIKQLDSRLGSLALALAKVSLAGAALGAPTIKIARFVGEGLAAADSMAKLSRRLGVSAKDIAAFGRAAELSGTTQQAVTTAIERMSVTLGDAARGSKSAGDALRALGLNAEQMLSMAPAAAFSRTASAIAAIEHPTRRSDLAIKIMGRSAGQLATLLATESETMARARREAELFGTALSASATLRVEAANDAISRLGLAAEGLSVHMAVAAAPAVERFGDSVESAVESMGGMAAIARHAGLAAALKAVAAGFPRTRGDRPGWRCRCTVQQLVPPHSRG